MGPTSAEHLGRVGTSAVGSGGTSKDTVKRQCVEMCAEFTN